MWYFGTHGDRRRIPDPKPEDGPEGLRKYDPEGFTLVDNFYGGRTQITKIEARGSRVRTDTDSPTTNSSPVKRTAAQGVDNR